MIHDDDEEGREFFNMVMSDPKIVKSTHEIFKYVIQPNCKVKYNEDLLSLEDKARIVACFMRDNEDFLEHFAKGRERKEKDEQTSNTKSKRFN